MRLFRRSKERRSKSGDARPVIEVAEIKPNPDQELFFDGTDLKVLFEKSDEWRPTPTARAPESCFRRLPKRFQKAPAPPAAPEYRYTHLFRHVNPEDKLINWGADPITGVCYESLPRYLDPPTESVRFVASVPPAPQVEKLPGGKLPVESRRHCAARPPGQVSVEPPRSQVEAPAAARPAQPTVKVGYLKTLPAKKSPLKSPIRQYPERKDETPPPPPHTPLPVEPSIPDWLKTIDKGRSTTVDQLSTETPRRRRSRRKGRRSRTRSEDAKIPNVQEPENDPRPTPVDSAKVPTKSSRNLVGQLVERKIPFSLILRVLMSIIHHVLMTFNQFLPAWRILRDSKVGRDELMDAWRSVWLAMVYFVALWGLFTTVEQLVCFLAEGVNWVLGIVSLIMVLSMFSSCCLVNG